MTQLFDKLRQRMNAREEKAYDAYRAMVRQIGDDAEVSPEKVEKVIAAVQKSFAELEGDVALYQRRKKMRATLDTLPDHQARVAELEAALEHKRAEFETVLEEFRAQLGKLKLEWRGAVSQMHAASSAEMELRQTFADAPLIQRRDALETERRRRSQGVVQLKGIVQRLEGNIQRLHEFEAKPQTAAVREKEIDLRDQSEKLSDARARLEDAEQELAGVNAEMDALREIELQP